MIKDKFLDWALYALMAVFVCGIVLPAGYILWRTLSALQ